MGFCSFSKISPGTASNDLNSCLMISGCFINENNTAYLTLTLQQQIAGLQEENLRLRKMIAKADRLAEKSRKLFEEVLLSDLDVE